jgi:hypothetical protein
MFKWKTQVPPFAEITFRKAHTENNDNVQPAASLVEG